MMAGSVAPWRVEQSMRGEGPTWRVRVLDAGDVTDEGTRAVTVRVYHSVRRGIMLHVQPARVSQPVGGLESETFVMFCPEPRDKPLSRVLRAAARRSDKATGSVAAAILTDAWALAAAYLVDPASAEVAATLAALTAKVAP
jgi:hypothetical protein